MSEKVSSIYLHYVWIGQNQLPCNCYEKSKHCIKNIEITYNQFLSIYPDKKIKVVLHTDVENNDYINLCNPNLIQNLVINKITIEGSLQKAFQGRSINFNGKTIDLYQIFMHIFVECRVYMAISDVMRIMENIMDYKEPDDTGLIFNFYIDTDDYFSFELLYQESKKFIPKFDILEKIYNDTYYFRLFQSEITEGYSNNFIAFFYNPITSKIVSDNADEIEPGIIRNLYIDNLSDNILAGIQKISSKPDFKKSTFIHFILEVTGYYNLYLTHHQLLKIEPVTTYKNIGAFNPNTDHYLYYDQRQEKYYVTELLFVKIAYYTSLDSCSGITLNEDICKCIKTKIDFIFNSMLNGGNYINKYLKYMNKNKQ